MRQDERQITFSGNNWVVRSAVMGARLKGVVCAETMEGKSEEECKPLNKPQDKDGVEHDIYLCVPGAEKYANLAKGFAFTLITKPYEGDVLMAWGEKGQPDLKKKVKGSRLKAMTILSKQGAMRNNGCDVEAKPPERNILFYKHQ